MVVSMVGKLARRLQAFFMERPRVVSHCRDVIGRVSIEHLPEGAHARGHVLHYLHPIRGEPDGILVSESGSAGQQCNDRHCRPDELEVA